MSKRISHLKKIDEVKLIEYLEVLDFVTMRLAAIDNTRTVGRRRLVNDEAKKFLSEIVDLIIKVSREFDFFKKDLVPFTFSDISVMDNDEFRKLLETVKTWNMYFVKFLTLNHKINSENSNVTKKDKIICKRVLSDIVFIPGLRGTYMRMNKDYHVGS